MILVVLWAMYLTWPHFIFQLGLTHPTRGREQFLSSCSPTITPSSLTLNPTPIRTCGATVVTMTTGECCHLPGSLCDCAGNAALSKSVEEVGGDARPAQYITQVTAKDGRLLSTVLKPPVSQR